MKTGYRLFGFAVMTVVALALFAVPSIAAAEQITLCQQDSAESSCPEDDVATHIHEATLSGEANQATLLSSVVNVKCDALFLGDTLGLSGKLLVIHGHFTYTNCKSGCIVTEEIEEGEEGESSLEVSKTGHETAKIVGQGEVLVHCGFFIKCVYNGTGLEATAHGPLLSSETNGSASISGQETESVSGFCPEAAFLDLLLEPLEKIYIRESVGTPLKEPPPPQKKTALCTTDEVASTCLEEHKPSTVDFKDSALEFLTNLLNFKCEGLVSGSPGIAGKPQEVKAEYKYSACSSSCVVTEVSGGSKLFFLLEGEYSKELAATTAEGLELFVKCGTTIKCTFGPAKLSGDGLGALATKDNGHITFSKASLGEHEGVTCPSEASLDALYVASSATYLREDYVKPQTALCSKDEGTPICKSENQLKSIDYKDSAIELLTNLINVKCEGLASGTVGAPGNPLEIEAEFTYTSCSGGCFVTDVSGPGKILLQREGKAEEASATSEGFEIFVKCGTTIKCLLGPEKMAGKALGALSTGDNGHLTFSKVSMGKGEGAVCPSEAKLDALFVASSAAYIG
jgi:hypothetical protein